MDPQITYRMMIDAIQSRHWQEASEHCDHLAAWMKRGGYPPTIDPKVTKAINEQLTVVAISLCRQKILYESRGALCVGQWYWVTGGGPMRLDELPNPPQKTTVTLRPLGGGRYWAAPEDISSPATPKLLANYRKQLLRMPIALLKNKRKQLRELEKLIAEL